MATTIPATWTRLAKTQQLQRSSQCISVVNSSIYLFGGELKPREPRDNDMHIFDTRSISGNDSASLQTIPASTKAPTPRVGSAWTRIGPKIYMFSGRGGVAMAPLDEAGAIWEFDTSTRTWTLLAPNSGTNTPAARSYHAMTADGKGTIYLHAGCPEKGRLGDLWTFDVGTRTWTERASALGSVRGGTSVAFLDGKVYRMNGFDGTAEVGGALDVYDVASGAWTTIEYAADGKTGPGARSVSALVPASIQGQEALVTLFGESDPSALGHAGAGKMLTDVWAYLVGKGVWAKVEVDGGKEVPEARGWFAADGGEVGGKSSVVVTGGLGESNERLDDLWVLQF